MLITSIIIVWLILLFGFVVMFGAPYVPTLKKQKDAAIDLMDIQPGQTVIELGSGDGTMLKTLAEKGVRVIGYELNPLLVLVSYIRTFKLRKNVKIIWGNYWTQIWPRTDAIYAFLLDRYMEKLDKKIVQNYPEQKVKLASYAFKIPGREPSAEKSGVYLYEYK